jgi:hypothetical protein
MIPDPAPPYEVGMSDNLRERLRGLTREAAAIGIGNAFRDQVQTLLESLRDNPREAGDPLRGARGMYSVLYRLAKFDLILYYTVHDRIPMVTLWQFDLGPNHPLAPPDSNGN